MSDIGRAPWEFAGLRCPHAAIDALEQVTVLVESDRLRILVRA